MRIVLALFVLFCVESRSFAQSGYGSQSADYLSRLYSGSAFQGNTPTPQQPGPAIGPGYSPGLPFAAPTARWDYRFDGQYQSTILPYLRWYMRPEAWAQGYYPPNWGMGFQSSPYGNFGTSQTGGCSCGSADTHSTFGGPGYGYPTAAAYAGSTYARRPGMPLASGGVDIIRPTGNRPVVAQTSPSRRKHIWVARHEETGLITVRYRKPEEAQRNEFFPAMATIEGSHHITSLDWLERPDWSALVHVHRGVLAPVRTSRQPASDVAPAPPVEDNPFADLKPST